MKLTSPLFTLLLVTLLTIGCSNSDNDTTPETENPVDTAEAMNTEDTEQPVNSAFHIIQPADVDGYIADFESALSRVRFTNQGVEHSLEFLDFDFDENQLLARYDNYYLGIGFDMENEVPLPSLLLTEFNEEMVVVKQYSSTDLMISATVTDDYLYSGTLTDLASDEQIAVTLVVNPAFVTAGNTTITISGTDATLNGDLGTSSYIQIRDMINKNPSVNRLIIQKSNGSVNDAINMHTGRLVRVANLATHVPADGDINSGAVDLFAAGTSRTVDEGGVLGVHSWCCENGVTADKLSRSDPAHDPQLTYFREMLPTTGVDFYFFTLDSATFDSIHTMTREEMVFYELVN